MRTVEARRIQSRSKARELLQAIDSGQLDAYEGYRQLYGVWCSNNAAVQELRPLFRMPGIDPDGVLSVTSEFRSEVRRLVSTLVLTFQP